MAERTTPDPVREQTAHSVNARLDAETNARIAYFARHPEAIGRRLKELDAEWDIDRTIELEAAGTIMTGLGLGMAKDKKWFLLPLFASSMLLLYSGRGTYPMLPVFRRLGFRSSKEIAQERYALKALRGDFDELGAGQQPSPDAAFAAADPTAA